MEIEVVTKAHIRLKDERGISFDLYTFTEGGMQIISTENRGLEVEDRLPRSIIIRERK